MSISITGVVLAAAKTFAFAFAFAHKAEAYGDSGRDFVPEKPEEEVVPQPALELHDQLPDGVMEDNPDWERVKYCKFSRKEVGSHASKHGQRLMMLANGSLEVTELSTKKRLVLERVDERYFYAKGIVWERVD